MSYTNGIGAPQQLPVASEAVVSASRAAKTESTSMPVSQQNGSTSPTPVDHANLSSTAGLVSQALSGSDVRGDKVAALQQTIAAGTYSVSSSDVAAKVMSALLK